VINSISENLLVISRRPIYRPCLFHDSDKLMAVYVSDSTCLLDSLLQFIL
jgi:hypothetical protein